MIPVWLLVPVLVLGVLVGAALGWWMRQRRPAEATQSRQWGAEPAPPRPAVPERPADGHGTEAALKDETSVPQTPGPEPATAAQAAPAPQTKPAQAAGTELQPAPGTAPEPAPEAAAKPGLQPEFSPDAPRDPSTTGGEGLDARMDDVLSELERRYRGRRVDPADAPDEPDPASRPRRPRRRP